MTEQASILELNPEDNFFFHGKVKGCVGWYTFLWRQSSLVEGQWILGIRKKGKAKKVIVPGHTKVSKWRQAERIDG